MRKLIALFLLGLALGSTFLQAVWPLAVPNTFSTGDIIDAAKTNSNFSTIYTDYTAKFDPSAGHRHAGIGTDGAKVYATDLNSTGGKANQFLQADGSNASSWTGVENTLAGRLERQSATQLRYNVYNGRHLEINGEIRVVDGTVAGGQINTTDNLITATGADAGAAQGASTLYYDYCSNSSASPFPTGCRSSATAFSTYRGGAYLGTSGNAANWRLVGMHRTNGSTQIVDSATQRFVLSWLNRRPVFSVLTSTTATPTSAAPLAELDTAFRVEFLCWANTQVLLSVTWGNSANAAGQLTSLANGLDAATTGNTVRAKSNIDGYVFAIHVQQVVTPAEGYHFNTPMVGVGNTSFVNTTNSIHVLAQVDG